MNNPSPIGKCSTASSDSERNLLSELRDLERRSLRDLEERLKEQAQASLSAFLRQAWPILEPETPLVWGWHVGAICEHLEAVSRKEIQNLIVSVPPGSSKSRTSCVFWPAWEWINHPSTRWLSAANDASLALRDAVTCRHLIQSDWYQERWGSIFQLTSDQNLKGYYENDAHGHRIALGVESRVQGKKGDILLVDDANDANQVESEAERRSVINWWDNSFSNRVADFITGRRVVIGHRTHPSDLIGHLLERGGWVHLMIPEEYDPPRRCSTPIWSDPRTVEGEWLRPDRFGPVQAAEEKKKGHRHYAAQHQQLPVPVEGNLFKKEWLQYWTTTGGYYVLGPRVVLVESCRRFGTADLATSTHERGDWTVICIWDDDRMGNLILVDMLRAKMEGPDLVPAIRSMWHRWEPSWIGVERMCFQLSIVQAARREGLPIRELSTNKDKVTHALAAETRFQARQVWFPQNASWLGVLEAELLAFPYGDHDDCVDNVSYACEEMVRLYHTRRSEGRPILGTGMAPVDPLKTHS